MGNGGKENTDGKYRTFCCKFRGRYYFFLDCGEITWSDKRRLYKMNEFLVLRFFSIIVLGLERF